MKCVCIALSLLNAHLETQNSKIPIPILNASKRKAPWIRKYLSNFDVSLLIPYAWLLFTATPSIKDALKLVKPTKLSA